MNKLSVGLVVDGLDEDGRAHDFGLVHAGCYVRNVRVLRDRFYFEISVTGNYWSSVRSATHPEVQP